MGQGFGSSTTLCHLAQGRWLRVPLLPSLEPGLAARAGGPDGQSDEDLLGRLIACPAFGAVSTSPSGGDGQQVRGNPGVAGRADHERGNAGHPRQQGDLGEGDVTLVGVYL